MVNAFANITRPGVFLNEGTAGIRPTNVASHNAIYMVGSATNGPYNQPTSVVSLADFTNQFAGSLSEPSVRLAFRNDRQAKLFFIRAGIAPKFDVTISSATAGNYKLTINGVDVTYTAIAGNTAADIAAGLIVAINSSAIAAQVNAKGAAQVDKLQIILQNPEGLLTVLVASGAATVTNATPANLSAGDFVSAIENSFDYEEEWEQGFLIAPQAFQYFTLAIDRLTVGAAMETLAANSAFDWKALIDCGPVHLTSSQLKTDAEQYPSPEGHSDYLAPYVIDFEGATVPPSAGAAAIATKTYREDGYHQPYAGSRYPMAGVADVDVKFGNTDQSILNPIGVNLVRKLTNKGVVIWGMRSRSQNPFYRFSVTRIIMNVLNGTLRRAYDDALFSSIDGFGIALMRREETARAVCRRMWISKALYGNTETEAFEVRSSIENNDADQLENGNVLIEVWAAPAPAIEKVLVQTYRTSIGKVQEAAAAGIIV